MVALSEEIQRTRDFPDLEWLMHYQIPQETLQLYYEADLEERPSTLSQSKLYSDSRPGNGLFTTIDRKAGEFVCAFPGYWMHQELYHQMKQDHELNGTFYAFTTAGDAKWQGMHDLVYMTHRCAANKINAGKIKDEVT